MLSWESLAAAENGFLVPSTGNIWRRSSVASDLAKLPGREDEQVGFTLEFAVIASKYCLKPEVEEKVKLVKRQPEAIMFLFACQQICISLANHGKQPPKPQLGAGPVPLLLPSVVFPNATRVGPTSEGPPLLC